MHLDFGEPDLLKEKEREDILRRTLRLESLENREVLSFGDINPDFADQGSYEVSYTSLANAFESVFESVEVDGGYLHFANSRSGSGGLISVFKTDLNGVVDASFGLGGMKHISGKPNAIQAGDVVKLSSGALLLVARKIEVLEPMLLGLTSTGDLDESFGHSGYLFNSIPISIYEKKVLPTNDGGFTVLQSSGSGLEVIKHDAHGNLVPTFGSNGTFTLPRLYDFDAIITKDGKVRIVGMRSDFRGDVWMESYLVTPDGELDNSYGNNGKQAIRSSGNPNPTIDPFDGSVYYYSRQQVDPNTWALDLSKLSGDLDVLSTFGTAGSIRIALRSKPYSGNVHLHLDGLGGFSVTESYSGSVIYLNQSSMAVTKFFGDGSIDKSYGVDGVFSYELNRVVDLRFPQFDSAGNLLWHGTVSPNRATNSIFDALIVKATNSGTFDDNFGTNGYMQIDLTVQSSTVSSLNLLKRSNGSMTVISGWPPLGSEDYYVGAAATLNDLGEVQSQPFFGGYGSQIGLVTAATSQGGMIIGQRFYDEKGKNHIRVSRTLSTGELDPSFGDEGRILIPTERMEDIFLHTSKDGSITIAAGNYEKFSNPETSLGVAIVIRLDSRGDLLTQFGTGGFLRIYEKVGTLLDVLEQESLGTALVFYNYDGNNANTGIAISVFDHTGRPLPSFGNNGTAMGIAAGRWQDGDFDEQGRLIFAIAEYGYQSGYRLFTLSKSGQLARNFGNEGVLELPIDFDPIQKLQIAANRGLIVVAGLNLAQDSSLRLVALDYAGRPATELGPTGLRDYPFSGYGGSVVDAEFSDDGSIWLAAFERHEFDMTGRVVRLEGSQSPTLSNWNNFLDVNNNDIVTPSDALMVINILNRTSTVDTKGLFPDVSADGLITAQDVLMVIDHLNSRTGSGEGESSMKEKGRVGELLLFSTDVLIETADPEAQAKRRRGGR